MEEKFLKIVADSLEVDKKEISMDTVYKDYEPWSSMAMMGLIMDLEEEYGVSIPIEKVSSIKTLRDMYNLVQG